MNYMKLKASLCTEGEDTGKYLIYCEKGGPCVHDESIMMGKRRLRKENREFFGKLKTEKPELYSKLIEYYKK